MKSNYCLLVVRNLTLVTTADTEPLLSTRQFRSREHNQQLHVVLAVSSLVGCVDPLGEKPRQARLMHTSNVQNTLLVSTCLVVITIRSPKVNSARRTFSG